MNEKKTISVITPGLWERVTSSSVNPFTGVWWWEGMPGLKWRIHRHMPGFSNRLISFLYNHITWGSLVEMAVWVEREDRVFWGFSVLLDQLVGWNWYLELSFQGEVGLYWSPLQSEYDSGGLLSWWLLSYSLWNWPDLHSARAWVQSSNSFWNPGLRVIPFKSTTKVIFLGLFVFSPCPLPSLDYKLLRR